MTSMSDKIFVRDACAQAAHEMNRIYCSAIGDSSQVPWNAAPAWQRNSAYEGVDGVFAGNGPGASHESWLATKVREGWVYGPVKDPVAKTHPCMVSFEELPIEQQQKDFLFVETVRSMATALGYAIPTTTTVRDGLIVGTRSAR